MKKHLIFIFFVLIIIKTYSQDKCNYCDSLNRERKTNSNFKAYNDYNKYCLTRDTVFFNDDLVVNQKKMSSRYEVKTHDYCSKFYLFQNIRTKKDSTIFGFEVENNDTVFLSTEKIAMFKGGIGNLIEYLKNNVVYPKKSRKKGVEGTVYITFVIDKSGKVTNPYVIKGVDIDCDTEALRVIKSMPDWDSAEYKNRKVKMRFNIPIVFKLE